MITSLLYDRNFGATVIKPRCAFDVQSMSWQAVGGAKQATIKLTGDENALWESAQWLRCPIELFDETGEPVWWGYVSEARFSIGKIEIGMSLDSMSNRIAIAYSDTSRGNTAMQRATTAFTQDDESVSVYGAKELLFSASDATQEVALSLLHTKLNDLRYPQPTVSWDSSVQVGSGTLVCKGWFDSLAWKYYANAEGMATNNPGNSETQDFGKLTGCVMVAQRFRIDTSESWKAYYCTLKIRKIGAPTDDILCELCTDTGGGLPNTVLSTATFPQGQITTNAESLQVAFVPPIDLQPNVDYWIKIRRNGIRDDTNYYDVPVSQALTYTNGYLRIMHDTQWDIRDPDADLVFEVSGLQETSAQISKIVTTSGQFVSGADIETSSGVVSNQYRNGDTTAQKCLSELLAIGTSNNRRYLAEVTRERRLRVFEEPAIYTNDYFVLRDGGLANPMGIPLRKAANPTGVWATLKDVIASSAIGSFLGDSSTLFVEQAEYDVMRDRMKIIPRSASNPLAVARISNK